MWLVGEKGSELRDVLAWAPWAAVETVGGTLACGAEAWRAEVCILCRGMGGVRRGAPRVRGSGQSPGAPAEGTSRARSVISSLGAERVRTGNRW